MQSNILQLGNADRNRIDKDAPSISASKEEANRMYDLGNLTLFLAGDMSEMIASSIISLDGRYASVD